MDPQFEPERQAVALTPPRNAKQLDPVAQLFCKPNIFRVEMTNPLDVCGLKSHRRTERNRGHDGRLMCGIDPVNIEGRIGLGVTELLSLSEDFGKRQAARPHLGKNEIRSAVDDPGDPLDPVRGQAFTQGLDDRNTTRYGGLKCNHHATLVSRGKDGIAMHCKQRFVGRHHMFTGGNGAHHQGARNVITTNELDNNVDIGGIHNSASIGRHFSTTIRDPSGSIKVEVCNSNDLNGAPGSPRDLIGIAG